MDSTEMNMKRLVTQFDDTRTKATVATPTCSSCCCCCCCVASLLTTSAVTAMNVRDLGKQNSIEPSKATLYKVGAFFIFPLAIALGVGSAFVLSILALAVTLVVWILLLKAVYKKAGLAEPSKIIGVTVGAGTAFFIGEFIGGAGLVLYGPGGIAESSSGGGGGTGAIIYLVLAAGLPFLLVPLLRKLTRPLLVQEVSAVPQAAVPAAPAQSNEPVVYSESESPHTMDNDQSNNSSTDGQPPKPQE